MGFYKGRRRSNLYQPGQNQRYPLSRYRIDNFLRCARCFYMDRRMGVDAPPGFPFNLNSAVDLLLKKEFDHYRELQEPHPMMVEAGIDAVPFAHIKIDDWRENFKGVRYVHEATNFEVTGAVDDLWVKPDGSLIVVDYKATSRDQRPTLDKPWQIAYKRQMEIYQWLLRGHGFQVDPVGYFVYCNGRRDVPQFDKKLEFTIDVIAYQGSDDWVDQVLMDAKACLELDKIPQPNQDCDNCLYRKEAVMVVMEQKKNQ